MYKGLLVSFLFCLSAEMGLAQKQNVTDLPLNPTAQSSLSTYHNSDTQKNNSIFPDVIYPRIRIHSTPSSGEEPRFNSPSLEWPSKKNGVYSVRMSTTRNFDKNVLQKNAIPYAIYNPHKILGNGIWYWQYKIEGENWHTIDSFVIHSSTTIFPTPEIKQVLQAIPKEHPRVLVRKEAIGQLRSGAKNYRETQYIIQEAESYLVKSPPAAAALLPAYQGKNDFENNKIALLSSKKVGWNIYQVLTVLSQAYILTGNNRYFETAKKWMLEVSQWDPMGPSRLNDFGDAGIMAGMAVGVDTFWDLLSEEEKDFIIKPATVRANNFYKLWKSQVESRSSSMHVWQHILHRLLYTSIAFKDKVPEAELWLEYIYELWIAQSPKMADTDGAWINGTGYFGMNTLTLIDVSGLFQELTGVDFMWSKWYRNSPHWLIYAFPPNSVADGFCNDGNKYPVPTIHYAGYADAAARLFQDPYARWYADEITSAVQQTIADDDEFRWCRIRRGYKKKLPPPLKKFDLPQAAQFPDVGDVYMNTSIQHIPQNLMLSIRSSPFGSLAHTHADQNTFNIAYGGKRLFYNTGYRPAMGDPHFLGWYKDTRGHNGILINGKGQPFSDGAYGWIPRFLHSNNISYAVGDASNAYSGEFDKENTDLGMKHFRRHYIMLRPSIIVIYDEVEADHDAQWSWLLHSDSGFTIQPDKQVLLAQNEHTKASVSLFSSAPLDCQITNQFSVPVDNWTNRVDEQGDTLVFTNQWHFSGINKVKNDKMRFLAIFQVKPDGNFHDVIQLADGNFKIGNWNIAAQLNVSEPANIRVWNTEKTDMLVSDGKLNWNGKSYSGKSLTSSKIVEMKNGKPVFQECADEIPAAMQRMMFRERQQKK